MCTVDRIPQTNGVVIISRCNACAIWGENDWLDPVWTSFKSFRCAPLALSHRRMVLSSDLVCHQERKQLTWPDLNVLRESPTVHRWLHPTVEWCCRTLVMSVTPDPNFSGDNSLIVWQFAEVGEYSFFEWIAWCKQQCGRINQLAGCTENCEDKATTLIEHVHHARDILACGLIGANMRILRWEMERRMTIWGLSVQHSKGVLQ